MEKLMIDILRKSRLDKGLKQIEVAEILGVKKNTISNWENNRANPDVDSLIKLCSIYGISCSSLLDEVYGTGNNSMVLSSLEKKILLAYRNSDPYTKELIYRALRLNEVDELKTPEEYRDLPAR